MGNQPLLILLIKNPIIGKVKTRLAKDVGNSLALKVYQKLYDYTLRLVKDTGIDVHIYFSEFIPETTFSNHIRCFTQQEGDLGERMLSTFKTGFTSHSSCLIIGSDCFDLTIDLIKEAVLSLQQSDVVIGPAKDGGYYLLGMNKLISDVFQNQPWSQENLLQSTLQTLKKSSANVFLLEELNDIDELTDVQNSSALRMLLE